MPKTEKDLRQQVLLCSHIYIIGKKLVVSLWRILARQYGNPLPMIMTSLYSNFSEKYILICFYYMYYLYIFDILSKSSSD